MVSSHRVLKQAASTAWVSAKQVFDGGIASMLAGYAARFIGCLAALLFWAALADAKINLAGFTKQQLLSYTLLSAVLRQQMDIITPATSSLWEGSVIGRYTRPMPVYASYIAETIGKWWIPTAVFFSLPVLVFAGVMGINILPQSMVQGILFCISMFLSIVIGFGVDILFAAFAMQLKNSVWMATRMREAVYSLLSGALIPFALLPREVALVFSLLPFGSVANAPLSIFVGMGNAGQYLILQAFWAVAIWVFAHMAYKKSEEKMVSYGG